MDGSLLGALAALAGPLAYARLLGLGDHIPEVLGKLHESGGKVKHVCQWCWDRFRQTPGSEKHLRALENAYRSVWSNLRLALATRGWLGRCRLWLAAGKTRAFCRKCRACFEQLPGTPNERETMLAAARTELKTALRRKQMNCQVRVPLLPADLALPSALEAAAREAVPALAEHLESVGYASLARLLRQLTTSTPDLLTDAFTEAFQDAVHQDRALSRYLDDQLRDGMKNLLEAVHAGVEALQVDVGRSAEQTLVILERTAELPPMRVEVQGIRTRLESLTARQAPASVTGLVRRATEASALARRHGLSDLASRLVREVIEPLEESELRVGLVGEFSVGKSSLLNALLGESLLPTAGRASSATVVELRHGDRGFRLRSGSESRELTESEFRDRAEREIAGQTAATLEATLPASVLADLTLVDTPGTQALGDQAERWVAETLPKLHAALLVIDAKRGLSRTVVALLREQVLPADLGKWVVVVNKCDRIPEADRPALLEHFRRATSEWLGTAPRLIACSALAAEPGIEALRDLLCKEFVPDRWEILRRRSASRFADLLRDLDLALEVRSQALSLSEARVVALRNELADRKQLALKEVQRLSRYLEERFDALEASVPERVRGLLERVAGRWSHDKSERSVEQLAAWLRRDLESLREDLQEQIREMTDTVQGRFEPLRTPGTALPADAGAGRAEQPSDPLERLIHEITTIGHLSHILSWMIGPGKVAWAAAILGRFAVVPLLQRAGIGVKAVARPDLRPRLLGLEPELTECLTGQLIAIRRRLLAEIEDRHEGRLRDLQVALAASESDEAERQQQQAQVREDRQRLQTLTAGAGEESHP